MNWFKNWEDSQFDKGKVQCSHPGKCPDDEKLGSYCIKSEMSKFSTLVNG